MPVDRIGGTSIGAIMAIGPGMGWDAATGRAAGARRRLPEAVRLHAAGHVGPARRADHRQARAGPRRRRHRRPLGPVLLRLHQPHPAPPPSTTTAVRSCTPCGPASPSPACCRRCPSTATCSSTAASLDNVPVDEMRRRNPTGTIIAVDVAPDRRARRPTDDYGLSVSGPALVPRPAPGPRSAEPRDDDGALAAPRLGARPRAGRAGRHRRPLPRRRGGRAAALLDFSTADADRRRCGRAPPGRCSTELGLAARHARASYARPRHARHGRSTPGADRRGGVLLLTLRDLQYRAARFASVMVGHRRRARRCSSS